MDEINKSSFDFSNLGGLLFGGDDSGLGEYLSPTQQKAMQNQALMSAAMSLLKNSGYTTQPVSLGQALGSAYEAGKTGYQSAQQNAIQQLLTKQKLDEARRAQASLDAYQKFITGIPVEGQAITPEQAISAPGMAIGPTVERANLIGQPISGATMPSAGTPLTPQMQRLLSFLPPEKGILEAIKMMQPPDITGAAFKAADGKFYYPTKRGAVLADITPADLAAEEYGAAVPEVVGGQTQMVQYNKKGDRRVVTNVMPYEKPPADPEKITMLKAFNLPLTIENLRLLDKPEAKPEKMQYLEAMGLPITLENLRLLDKPEADPEKIKYLKELKMPITLENLRLLDKPDALPSEIEILKLTNTPVTIENVKSLRRSAATTVTVNEGQKGFENEMSLGKAFKSEPIYKDFNDMKSAFSQVVSSFKQGTPIGDVAGATKIMKLLDPGSVVRESELAIAMQAGGRLDRLKNYFNMWASGEKLTPTQRDEFQALANELYAAAGQAYNQKRAEYESFGRSYGFKNLDTALGAQATLPSIVKKPTANAPAGAAKPKVGKLVTDPKTGVTRYVEE